MGICGEKRRGAIREVGMVHGEGDGWKGVGVSCEFKVVMDDAGATGGGIWPAGGIEASSGFMGLAAGLGKANVGLWG